jgi:hypothetical protein
MNTTYKRSDLPLKRYLEKIPEDYKKALKKRFRIILNELHFPSEIQEHSLVNLNESLRLLGTIQVRRDMIIETNELIVGVCTSYSYIRPWVKELRELYDNCNKQLELANQLVRALLFEQVKNEEGSNEEAH